MQQKRVPQAYNVPERGRHDVELGVGELGDEDGDDSAVDDRLDLLVGAVSEVGEGLVISSESIN